MAFYGILWHFGIFAQKSNKISNPIFPILSDFYRFLDFSRLLDFPIPQLQYLLDWWNLTPSDTDTDTWQPPQTVQNTGSSLGNRLVCIFYFDGKFPLPT